MEKGSSVQELLIQTTEQKLRHTEQKQWLLIAGLLDKVGMA